MAQASMQRTFAGGEVSDAISARADLIKRAQGLKACLNGFIGRSGAWLNDAGTKFVAEVKDSTTESDVCLTDGPPETLIPFVFNAEQTYALEFGLNYVRFHRFGEPIIVEPDAYSAATDYSQGDVVREAGADYYCVIDNGPASTVVTPGTEATVWYEMPVPPSYYTGTGTSILEFPTPYAAGEITKQNVRQSGDVLFIPHKRHSPRRLERLADTTWRLIVTRFRPNIASPSGLSIVTQGGASQILRFQVTAVSKETGEESCAGHYDASSVASVTAADDVDVTLESVAHGKGTGTRIYISLVEPAAVADTNTVLKQAIEERDFFITVIDADHFSLDDTSGIPFTVAHDVTWHNTSIDTVCSFGPTRPVVLKCVELSEAAEYRWFVTSIPASLSGADGGLFGYVGSSIKPELVYGGHNPDYLTVAPFYTMEFERQDRHPHTCDFVQQRLVYARSERRPRSVRMSASANFENFTSHSPPTDDDPVSTTITGPEANELRHVIGMGPQLVALSLGTENAIRGDGDGIITPNANSQRVHGYNGSSNVRPVQIGASIIYIPREMNGVRSLNFDSVADGYVGGDMTVFASHLVDGQRLVDLAYARVPHSIAHVVRQDGVMLGMTHIPEHEILAWYRWLTATLAGQSRVLSICVIPEDEVSIVYMIVERVINGATVRYVEKKMKRCTTWESP